MVRAGCVFVAGIHPSRTWTSGSFESVRWNACVHRLDLGLYSHPKEFWGNGVWTHVNSKGKIPSTGKCPQRSIEPRDTVAASPSTTNWAIPAPLAHSVLTQRQMHQGGSLQFIVSTLSLKISRILWISSAKECILDFLRCGVNAVTWVFFT